jgi:hypothetical protein
MIRRSALVIAAFVLAAAGVGAARASTSAGRADMEVRVTAKDFSFVLSRKSVPHGRVEFVIKNAGKSVPIPHPLPVRDGDLPNRRAAARLVRRWAFRRLPSPAERRWCTPIRGERWLARYADASGGRVTGRTARSHR